jgi:hypothetical protein
LEFLTRLNVTNHLGFFMKNILQIFVFICVFTFCDDPQKRKHIQDFRESLLSSDEVDDDPVGSCQVEIPEHIDLTFGSGTPESCTESTLQEVFSKIGDYEEPVILVNCGKKPHTIPLTAQIDVNQAFTLFGTKVKGKRSCFSENVLTLDGQHQTRHFNVGANSGRIKIENLNLVHGLAKDNPSESSQVSSKAGGSFHFGVDNQVLFRNCYFYDNKIENDDNIAYGGALFFNKKNEVTIENSTFKENYSPSSGGAVSTVLSDLTVKNSYFVGNKIAKHSQTAHEDVGKGAAIKFDGGKSIDSGYFIERSFFSTNEIIDEGEGFEGVGGALFLNLHSKNQGKLFDNMFLSNRSLQKAGAVYLGVFQDPNDEESGSFVEVDRTYFEDNKATKLGGALHIDSGSKAKLSQTTFYKNSTLSGDEENSGGGIYIKGVNVDVLIEYSTFVLNTSSFGGAIHEDRQRDEEDVDAEDDREASHTVLNDSFLANPEGFESHQKTNCASPMKGDRNVVFPESFAEPYCGISTVIEAHESVEENLQTAINPTDWKENFVNYYPVRYKDHNLATFTLKILRLPEASVGEAEGVGVLGKD